MKPQLIFFTELEAATLAELAERSDVAGMLAGWGGISIAMFELSPEYADVVRTLKSRGVMVVARLLLPTDAGVWFNVENYPQAIAHYHAFREWARAEDLRFDAVGLDMQPGRWAVQGLLAANPLAIYMRLAAARGNALYPAAAEAYHALAAEIRAEGYAVHTYQFPFIVDDRRAATTLIQRALDVVDLPADVEVLLCYNSLVPRSLVGSDLHGALIAEYGPFADSLGVGSTGGGVINNSAADVRTVLTWNALARDLLLAAEYTDTIHVFSLEGCVAAGYLDRLRAFDWSADVVVPRRYRLRMAAVRLGIQSVLWWSRFGLAVLGWLGWVVAAGMLLNRTLRRWRKPS